MVNFIKQICKGKGKAKGEGCGNEYNPTTSLNKGLCNKCYADWLFTTKEGNKLIEKSTIKAKNEMQKIQKKETKEKKIELMGVDKYRAGIVQPIINEIARLIDYSQPCIATGKITGKMNGGHYYSVGSNRTICLNLHNIHIQSFHSNHFKSGDDIKYREGLIATYGEEYYNNKVESLKKIEAIHLSKKDLIEIWKKAVIIRNELRNNLVVRTPEERIKLRDEINKRLGIY